MYLCWENGVRLGASGQYWYSSGIFPACLLWSMLVETLQTISSRAFSYKINTWIFDRIFTELHSMSYSSAKIYFDSQKLYI